MTSVDLDYLIMKFEQYRKGKAKRFREKEELRKKFVRDFPPQRINTFTIDEYIQGKHSKRSFCYRLETGLVALGNMKGATSYKFGLYYGKSGKDREEKYRFTKKFGSTKKEALAKIKSSIVDLIQASRQNDTQKIVSSPLAPLVRYKLLATYFPNSFLDLYSEEHVNFFISELGLNVSSHSMLDKQEALIKFKNDHPLMRKWSNHEFTSFLYHEVGHPPSTREEKQILEVLPSLDKVRPELIELGSVRQPLSSKRLGIGNEGKVKTDYKDNANRNNRLGLRGENIVYNLEKQFLLSHELPTNKLIHISKTNDAAGYDIQSSDETGATKYIEVKSTRSKPEMASFIITSNEKRKAESLKNYYLYIVFEADTIHPKILRLKHPFRNPHVAMRITPISYRVEFRI